MLHASLRTDFAFLSFTQRKKCHMLPLFPGSDIVESTFHHSLKRMVPLSLRRGKRAACFSSYRFRILIFYAEEKVPHATVIPRLRHRGFYFPPSDKSDGPVTADWSMRYVCRLPEKLICKLEPDWDAEAARSVKTSSGLYVWGTFNESF